MKKVLLAIGMVLCEGMALAQNITMPLNANNETVGIVSSDELRRAGTPTVDYKGSVFAKVAGDTIKKWTFDGTTNNMPTIYGITGYVSSSMIVDGDLLTANSCSNPCSAWQHVYDSSFFSSEFYYNNYTLPESWIANMYENLDGGFMLSSYRGLNTSNSGRPHAYMEFAPQNCPYGASVIKVSFKQVTAKYYNKYFIDYKMNNTWYSVEVNVDGVDADINSWCAIDRSYTMPLAFANESMLQIRLRTLGSNIGNSYGYFWAIDDVALVEGEASSMAYQPDVYLEGGYSVIPQDMQLPLTWYAPVLNDGANTQTGVSVTMQHTSPTCATSILLTQSQADIYATNSVVNLVVDGRGFYTDFPGWYGYSANYGTTTTVTNNGLPTSVAGHHSVQALLGTNDLSHTYTACNYRVSTADSGVYTWARDNGVLASASYSGYGYTMGYTDEDNYGNLYITDEGHYNTEGYQVMLRYTTGNTLPTDNGDTPWVMRGLELVVDPGWDDNDINGAQIAPVLWKATYSEDGDYLNFNEIATGIISYTATGNEANYLSAGYLMPGNYNTIRFLFPNQPALEPNTSYYVGYRLLADADFSLAVSRNRYMGYDDDGNMVYMQFSNDSTLQPYVNNFKLNSYDILVKDPAGNGNGFWAALYSDNIPMIRPLVGPRLEMPMYTIYGNCDSNSTIKVGSTDICGDDINLTEGGDYQVVCTPAYGMMIQHLYVDGIEISINDPNLSTTHNYNGDWEYDVYSYTFHNLHADHIVSVVSGSTCLQPEVTLEDLDYESTQISWSGMWNAVYEVEYGLAGFTHGTGTTITVYESTSYTITGLNYLTAYDVYVRQICTDTTYSDWSTVVSFITDSLPNFITIVNHGGGYIYFDNGHTGDLAFDTTLIASTSYVEIQTATLDPEWCSNIGISEAASRVVRVVVDDSEYNLQSDSRFTEINDVMDEYGYIFYVINFTDGLAHNVDIYFGSLYPTVTTTVNNESLGFVTGGGNYIPGDMVSLTAVAYAGATFTGWNDGSTINPMNFTMAGDTTITANFAMAAAGEVVHDTVTVPVHDTTIVTIHDTTVVTNTVHDTTYVPVHDTTVVYADTTYIEVEVHDTIYLFDTVFIHDTIIIYDTTVTGVDEVVNSVRLYGENGQIVVEGIEGAAVVLYDAVGRMLATRRDDYGRLTFDVPASGVYMVKVGNHPARKVVVVR